MDLIRKLCGFCPCNEQEARDRETLLRALSREPSVFERSNLLMHMTASAWVTDASHAQVLMAYHNIYRSWAWLGGHADGERDLLAVAMREVREESGVQTLRPVLDGIFSVEVLTVDGHEKRGAYVPSHLHLNVTYLLEADAQQTLTVCDGENSGVRWFPLDDAVAASTEPWFQTRVYEKLNRKLRAL